MKLGKASDYVQTSMYETLAYMDFPEEHWRRIRTNNPIERVLKEVKRRTKVVGAFPDGESALMLTAARLRHVAFSKWNTKNLRGNRAPGQLFSMGMQLPIRYFMSVGLVLGCSSAEGGT